MFSRITPTVSSICYVIQVSTFIFRHVKHNKKVINESGRTISDMQLDSSTSLITILSGIALVGTHSLQSRSSLVSILCRVSCSTPGTSRRNIGIVRRLAVTHGDLIKLTTKEARKIRQSAGKRRTVGAAKKLKFGEVKRVATAGSKTKIRRDEVCRKL